MVTIAGVLLFTLVVLFWLMVIEILLADRPVGNQRPQDFHSEETDRGHLRHGVAACVCIVVASGD